MSLKKHMSISLALHIFWHSRNIVQNIDCTYSRKRRLMISSQAEKMRISWGVEKELKRTVCKPIGFTSGAEAHQSSGICLSGVPCLACNRPPPLLPLMCID